METLIQAKPLLNSLLRLAAPNEEKAFDWHEDAAKMNTAHIAFAKKPRSFWRQHYVSFMQKPRTTKWFLLLPKCLVVLQTGIRLRFPKHFRRSIKRHVTE
jgi:hypothetical protein